MIDLRNGIVDSGNKVPNRKICPIIPPVMKADEIIPVLCFGDDCEHYCEQHAMCMYKCEHIALHDAEIIDEDLREF